MQHLLDLHPSTAAEPLASLFSPQLSTSLSAAFTTVRRLEFCAGLLVEGTGSLRPLGHSALPYLHKRPGNIFGVIESWTRQDVWLSPEEGKGMKGEVSS